MQRWCETIHRVHPGWRAVFSRSLTCESCVVSSGECVISAFCISPVSVFRAAGWSCCLTLSVTVWACHAFVKCIIDYAAQQESRSPLTATEMKVYCLHAMLDNLLRMIQKHLFFLRVLSFTLRINVLPLLNCVYSIQLSFHLACSSM